MAKFIQTQKSFSYGQCGLSGFTNIRDTYHHSCKKLKNVIVENNGSIRVRGGWDHVLDFELASNQKFRDAFSLQGNYLFWIEQKGSDNTPISPGVGPEGLFIYDTTLKKLYPIRFSWNGARYYGDILGEKNSFKENELIPFVDDERFDGHGLEEASQVDIVNVLPFEDSLYVFFKDSYPFKIRAKGGVVSVVPFWEGIGPDNIWKCFPYNYTTNRRSVGSYYYRALVGEKGITKYVPAINVEEKLKLRISNVSIGNGECRAWIEPNFEEGDGSPDDGILLDKRYFNLQKFLGKPIAFRVGLKDLKVQKSLTSETNEDFIDEFYSRDDKIVSECSSARFVLESGRLRVSQFASNWRLSRQIWFRYPKKSHRTRLGLEGIIDGMFSKIRSSVIRNFPISTIAEGLGMFFPKTKNFNSYRSYLIRKNDFKKVFNEVFNRVIDAVIAELKRRIVDQEETRSPLCDLKNAIRSGRSFTADSGSNPILTLEKKYADEGLKTDLKIRLTQDSIDALRTYRVDRLSVNPVNQSGQVIESSLVYMTRASSRSLLRFIRGRSNSGSVVFKTERKDFTPVGGDLEEVFSVSNPSDPSKVLPATVLSGASKNDTAQQVLAKEAYNFYVIFPYQIVGDVDENNPDRFLPLDDLDDKVRQGLYAKCKIYEIGSQLSHDDIASDDLGEDSETDHYLESEDYILSDWVDGWPKSGGVLNNKLFFFTSGSKISFSRTEKPNIWGNPIKSLLHGPKYNLSYVENIDRPNDDASEEGDGVRFQTLLREDFIYPTKAIEDFFKEIQFGDDARQFSIADPLTYKLEDKNGLPVDVRRHLVVSVGVLTSVGVQCVFLTDKGAFYWGLTPGETQFFKVANVSNFIGGEDDEGHDYGMQEVLSKMFATSQDKELHVVDYDPNNRNFVAQPVGVDRGFKGFVHGVNFIGNRLLFIDRESQRMFCCGVSKREGLMGVSEFEVRDPTDDSKILKPQGLWQFGSDYYSAFLWGSKIVLAKYDDRKPIPHDDMRGLSRADRVKQGLSLPRVVAEVETAPATWMDKFAFNPVNHLDLYFSRGFIYTNRILEASEGIGSGIDVGIVGTNGKVFYYPLDAFIGKSENIGEHGVISFNKNFLFNKGEGFSFKFQGSAVIHGVAMQLFVGQ